jgi:Restriction endonuclease S subunits
MGLKNLSGGAGIPGLNRNDAYDKKIPLPPLEVQREIVAEIEGYQKIIDGARQVVESWKPQIEINPEWPKATIGECCEVKGGKRLPMGEQFTNTPTNHPYIRVTDFRDQSVDLNNLKFIPEAVYQQIARYTISSADVYISIAGTIGLMGTVPESLNGANLTENAAKLVFDARMIDKRFLSIVGNGDSVQKQIRSLTHAVGVPKLALERIKMLRIPLPPLEVQREIVGRIEAECKVVDGCKKLIALYEAKIKKVIDKVWEE